MNTAPTLSSKVVIASQVLSRQVREEEVILHLNSGTYFGLNEVGAEIWERLRAGSALETIVDYLVGEYAVSRERAAEGVLSLVRELADKSLVELQ